MEDEQSAFSRARKVAKVLNLAFLPFALLLIPHVWHYLLWTVALGGGAAVLRHLAGWRVGSGGGE